MGGVDGAGHYCSSYRFLRRSLKWWRKLYFWILEVSVVNSFHLCSMNQQSANLTISSHLEFSKWLEDCQEMFRTKCQVILIHTWRVAHRCVHTDVPATDSAWRSLYYRLCRWTGADVREYASGVASDCTNYLTPWCSLGEGTCKVMIIFGIAQASPFE
jgi:hypothetical protein